ADVGARGMWVAPDGEAADERPVVVLRDEDGRVRVAAQGLEEAALVPGAPPLAGDADEPALRLRTHRVGEPGQLLRIGRIGVPDLEAHASTTTAAPPRRGSPAPASEPSSRISTAETPPKKRFRWRQRTTGYPAASSSSATAGSSQCVTPCSKWMRGASTASSTPSPRAATFTT